jgi:dTDP-4-dehydrorhamnose 3,5-epimerase
MRIERLEIPGVVTLTPKRFGDERGYFSEVFRADILADCAPGIAFVQDNQSGSAQPGTVRGLHFQTSPHAQAKLIRVLRGAVLDVAVDLRRSSPAYGRHVHCMLSAENGVQLLVPAGFAHGFCTLAPDTEVTYKVSAYYNAAADKGLAWDDPALGIAWPVLAGKAVLSDKDKSHPRLADLPAYFD